MLYHDRARQRLRYGVDAVAGPLRSALGPSGRAAVIERRGGPPAVTSDGAAIADALELADPRANLGARLLREVVRETSAASGDGAATAAVLAQVMVDRGLRAVAAGAAPLAVRRGMDAAVAAVVTHLAAVARPVEEKADVAAVATIAAGEEEVGARIAEAFHAVGRDGVITVEASQGLELELDVAEGLRFASGSLSPHLVTDRERGEAVLEDAWILLFDARIRHLSEILPLLDRVAATRRPLLLVADEVFTEALAALVLNHVKGIFTGVPVKAPHLGQRRRGRLLDLAALTGAQIISPEAGLRLEDLGLEVLGRARRVVVTRDDTTVIGGAGDAAVLERRIAHVRHELQAATSAWDRDILRERLAKLTGGVAVLRVGGATEAAIRSRVQRVEAAVAATRAAVEEGIVPGGGAALVRSVPVLADDLGRAGDERAGVDAVRRALAEPLRCIARNAGDDGAAVAAVVAGLEDAEGYDARTRTYGDLFAAGVVDPVKVTRTALQRAASIAGLLLTTEVLVVPEPEPESDVLPGSGHHDHEHGHSHGH